MPPPQRTPDRARAGKVPKGVSAIALKALAKDPEARYPNVEALRRDIERFQEGQSVSAKEDSRREMVWKFVKRNKVVSAATTVALLPLGRADFAAARPPRRGDLSPGECRGVWLAFFLLRPGQLRSARLQ